AAATAATAARLGGGRLIGAVIGARRARLGHLGLALAREHGDLAVDLDAFLGELGRGAVDHLVVVVVLVIVVVIEIVVVLVVVEVVVVLVIVEVVVVVDLVLVAVLVVIEIVVVVVEVL